MNLFCRNSLCLLVFLIPNAAAFAQGPLTPPGSPGPTMKTLDQTEPRTPISSLPFTITRPGSYYVTTNLVASVNTNGITVRTNDVAIDLNGFGLVGAPDNIASAITVTGNFTNVVVRNGSLRGWLNGIAGNGIFRGQFLNLQVSHCTNSGILSGQLALVKQCSVGQCGGSGIYLSTGSTATDCIATENATGFFVDSSATLLGCRATRNRADGFVAQSGSTLVNCSASFNTDGLLLVTGSIAVNCSAIRNSGNGIRAELGSTVRDCNSYNNTVGISVGSACRIVNNTVDINTSTGILVSNSNNTIDGNHITETGGIGLRVTSGGNLVTRNNCSGNTTNFSVVANNNLGPILSPAASLTNASPWANFQF